METIDPSDSATRDTEPTPNFLLVRDSSGDWPRWKRAAIGSGCFHLFAITALYLIKSGPYEQPPPERIYVPYVTHLYIPKELTQKAPNKGQVAKVLMAPAIAPAPKTAPQAPAPRPAQATPPQVPAQQPNPTPKPPTPQPPVVTAPPASTQPEVARNQPPASTPPPAVLPRPEAPKMIVADSIQATPSAPKPNGIVPPSGNAIRDAMRTLSNGGPSVPRNSVGDSDEVGVGAGLNLPPSAGRPRSNLQLKSDPMGVDFKPYLLQVLQAVRTNWFAVYPTAARLGTRGQVVLEFAVTQDGGVVKVVFAGQSGAKALDQAAVAAISASNPLPPLPKEFKGDRIVLQMSFMYNMQQ